MRNAIEKDTSFSKLLIILLKIYIGIAFAAYQSVYSAAPRIRTASSVSISRFL